MPNETPEETQWLTAAQVLKQCRIKLRRLQQLCNGHTQTVYRKRVAAERKPYVYTYPPVLTEGEDYKYIRGNVLYHPNIVAIINKITRRKKR
jgi:hypothetical protein